MKEKKEQKNTKSTNKRQIKFNLNSTQKVILAKSAISSIIAIILTLVVTIIAIFASKNRTNYGITATAELAKAKTYDQVQTGEEATNSDYVTFDAFFLRDLNGDGIAEGVRGTCKEVGGEDTLYMELKVLTNGTLKNGKITVNSSNFYLQTVLPKDNEIKENYIDVNTREIELNDIKNGSQKTITGKVKTGNYAYESQ